MLLENIEKFNNTINDYKIIVIDNHLFLSQKFIFGTRLNMINYTDGQFIWKIDFFYFFDKFFVDLKMERVVFYCDNHFYVYNMRSKKAVAKMTCKDLDKSLCVFDNNRDGQVYTLIPYWNFF